MSRRRYVSTFGLVGFLVLWLSTTAVFWFQQRLDDDDDGEQILLPPIEIRGYKFFDSQTGQEFVVKGIDYFPRPNEGPLNFNSKDLYTSDHEHIWKRDIPHLQALGVNAIRLYAVDPTKNHDAFMCAMAQAGIYVMVALAHDCPTCAITRDAAPDCYPPELKQQGQAVIRSFSKYPNTLAFSAGNEVNHFAPLGQTAVWNAPCQKRFVRDMRVYMAQCAQAHPKVRQVPVGLISADDEREDLAMYYNCQSNEDDSTEPDPYERAEWYGLNTYVFCNGNATTYDEALGFQSLQASFESYHYSIPVLLTEFGCLSDTFHYEGEVGQRDFVQAKLMLTEPAVREQFAGGFAFEYSMEKENAKHASPWPFVQFGKQNYGVGYFSPEFCNDVNISCSYKPLPSYRALQQVYTNIRFAADDDTDDDTEDDGNPTTTATNATTMKTTTVDDFEPEEDRSKASKCPASFPSLNSFDWSDVDDMPNLRCPQMSRGGHGFQCPGASYAEESSSSSLSASAATETTSLFMILLGIVWFLLGALTGAVLLWRFQQNTVTASTATTAAVVEEDDDPEESARLVLASSSSSPATTGRKVVAVGGGRGVYGSLPSSSTAESSDSQDE